MENILILGVAAVQMDSIILLKKLGYCVHAIAMKKDGPGADAADYFTEIDILDIENVIKYCKENDIECVYSTGSDLAMPVVTKVNKLLGLKSFFINDVALTCNNKIKMREALGKNTIGNVPFNILDANNTDCVLEYPYIVKPADSQGQRGISLVENKNMLKEALETALSFSKCGQAIAEKYEGGYEVSVNTYFAYGELKYIAVSDRQTWGNFIGLIHKHIYPSERVDENVLNEIIEIVLVAAKKVKLIDGPFYLQMKVDDNIPYIVEMTPRLDGCHMWKIIQEVDKVNLLKLTYEHLIHNDLSELDNINKTNMRHEIVFMCQKPNSEFLKNNHKAPSESKEVFYYYNDGDNVRPVNGKYDKVGYYLSEVK